MDLYQRFCKWVARMSYQSYKAKLVMFAKKAQPLLAYPFLAFLELQLDEIFEKDGAEAAEKAVHDWLAQFDTKMFSPFGNEATDALYANMEVKESFKVGDRVELISDELEGRPQGILIDVERQVVRHDNGVITVCGPDTFMLHVTEGK